MNKQIASFLVKFDKVAVYDFDLRNFISLHGRTGLYFIFLVKLAIPYPFKNSRLIYIGMSESRINSIGKRLRDHFTGESNNKGIGGYKDRWALNFTYLDHEFLKHLFPDQRIQTTETFFLERFADNYGCYPICNNRRGDIQFFDSNKSAIAIKVDWKFFEE